MRLLLDTRTLLWAAMDPRRIPAAAFTALSDPENERFVSAASAWEIATKTRRGKLVGGALATDFVADVRRQGFRILPIGAQDAQDAGNLPGPHADPFDRMLVAQALRRGLVLVSNERAFDAYGVPRLWA